VNDEARFAAGGENASAHKEPDLMTPKTKSELHALLDDISSEAYPDEPVSMAWARWPGQTEAQIRGTRELGIGRHRQYIVFAKLMTFIGVPQICAHRNCRRTGKCVGNRREKDGVFHDLYRLHPPCYFACIDELQECGFIDELRQKIHQRLGMETPQKQIPQDKPTIRPLPKDA
jgi:hypothetical protein